MAGKVAKIRRVLMPEKWVAPASLQRSEVFADLFDSLGS